MNEPNIITTKIADEFRFVDKDIADAFRNTNALIGTALIAQLSRDIKELVKAIRSLKTELDGDELSESK